MAFGIKGWLGVTTLALLLVLGWGLAPVQEYPEAQGPLPERVDFLEVNRELSREAWTYQRLFRRDTLVGALMAGVEAGQDVVVGLPVETADSTRELVQRAVIRQLEDLGIESPAMPIGFFVVANGGGAFPGTAEAFSSLSYSDEVYLARDGESPYCLIANPYRWRRDPERHSKADAIAGDLRYRATIPGDPRQPMNLFSICRFFARHGSPGEPMLTWLQAGGSAFGREVLPTHHHLRLGRGPARGPFGKAGASWMGGSPRTELCLTGDREACRALLLDPIVRPSGVRHMEYDPRELIMDSPVDLIPRYPTVAHEMLGNQGILLSLLEEEFGPDRFRAFWGSDLPIPEAFEAAFGRPLDLWIMEWLRRYVDPPARGPGVPVQATLLSLLGVGLLAGGAVRMGRR